MSTGVRQLLVMGLAITAMLGVIAGCGDSPGSDSPAPPSAPMAVASPTASTTAVSAFHDGVYSNDRLGLTFAPGSDFHFITEGPALGNEITTAFYRPLYFAQFKTGYDSDVPPKLMTLTVCRLPAAVRGRTAELERLLEDGAVDRDALVRNAGAALPTNEQDVPHEEYAVDTVAGMPAVVALLQLGDDLPDYDQFLYRAALFGDRREYLISCIGIWADAEAARRECAAVAASFKLTP